MAVRALERAKGKRCNPTLISKHAHSLVAASGIPYVQNCPLHLSDGGAVVNTRFFVDHEEVDDLVRKEEDWRLGPLQEGEEFCAFVFEEVLVIEPNESYRLTS